MFYMNHQAYFTGWRYLLDHDFRQHVNHEWHTLPSPIVGLQILAGIMSILSPLAVVGFILLIVLAAYF